MPRAFIIRLPYSGGESENSVMIDAEPTGDGVPACDIHFTFAGGEFVLSGVDENGMRDIGRCFAEKAAELAQKRWAAVAESSEVAVRAS